MKQHQTRVESRASRAGQAKCYAPVTDFERATSYCPLYLAWRIVDEARDYFRTPIPEAFADQLARRAEAVFAKHPFMQRQFKSASGRVAILMFMRHWLAGVLSRERPVLFRDLPESFKVGHPLPDHSLTRPALRGHPLPSDGRGKTGGAAAPPYHKSKTVRLTAGQPQNPACPARPAVLSMAANFWRVKTAGAAGDLRCLPWVRAVVFSQVGKE